MERYFEHIASTYIVYINKILITYIYTYITKMYIEISYFQMFHDKKMRIGSRADTAVMYCCCARDQNVTKSGGIQNE